MICQQQFTVSIASECVFDSLASGDLNSRVIIFKLILGINGWVISEKVVLRQISLPEPMLTKMYLNMATCVVYAQNPSKKTSPNSFKRA